MKLAAWVRGLLPDVFLLAGAAVLTVGLWWWRPWVAMSVLGILLIVGGIFLERAFRLRQVDLERANTEGRRR